MTMPCVGRRDTPDAALSVQAAALRGLSASRRLWMCLDLSQTVIDLSRRALRRARPGATESDLRVEWVSLHYGVEIAKRFGARMEQLG